MFVEPRHHNFQLNSVQAKCLCGKEEGNVIYFHWLLEMFNIVFGENWRLTGPDTGFTHCYLFLLIKAINSKAILQ